MTKANQISISSEGLTDGEKSELEVLQLQAKFRGIGITRIWTFFKLDYPTYDLQMFRNKMNRNTPIDEDFIEKLASVYERQKK